MSLARIRDEYHVPARMGQPVALKAPAGLVHGTIVGSDGDLIIVLPVRGDPQFAAHPANLIFPKS